MTTKLISSWDDTCAQREYTIKGTLAGWRYSVAQEDGTVLPFVEEGGTTPAPTCIAPPKPGDPDGRIHNGEKVHPLCTCGWHFMRARGLLADYYLLPANRKNHADQKRMFEKNRCGWAGQVVCQVSASGNVVFGAHSPRLGVIDPPTVARASHMKLTALYIPGTIRIEARNRIIEANPGIPVTAMSGPLHTIRDAKYRRAGD